MNRTISESKLSNLKEVSYEEATKHMARKVVGPIPAGVNPYFFVGALVEDYNGLVGYHIKLYDVPREYEVDEAQYSTVQGTYWLLYKAPTGEYSPAKNNVVVDLYKEDVGVLTGVPFTGVVFTTGDREAAKILEKVCEDANVTDTTDEFHYQGWITAK